MKINRSTLGKNYRYHFNDAVEFSPTSFDPNYIRKISPVEVKYDAIDYGDILHLELDISCLVTGVCCYSLEDVEIPLHFKDELDFSDDKSLMEQCFFVEENMFDLDPYILGLILSNIPSKIVKKGAKLPKSGEGYRVLTEDEYLKEKSEEKDPRWDKLDELDL